MKKKIVKKDITNDEIDKIITHFDYRESERLLKQYNLDEEQIMKILNNAVNRFITPNQIKLLFNLAGKTKLLSNDKIKKDILNTVKKVHQKEGWLTKASGFQYLEAINEYGWLLDIIEDKNERGNLIAILSNVSAGRTNIVKADRRINKLLNGLKARKTEIMMEIYRETNNTYFLPKEAREVFLF
jgi:hypothetical protein